jgi:hypothetical protein
MYGRETSCKTGKDEVTLNTLKINVSRNMYGAVRRQGVWVMRTNQKLSKWNHPDLVQNVRMRRLERLEHLISMDPTRVVKKTFFRLSQIEVAPRFIA